MCNRRLFGFIYLNIKLLCGSSRSFFFKHRYLLRPVGRLFFPDPGHLYQQHGNRAECTPGHGSRLTAHTNGFKTGLIFQEIKRSLTVFTDIVSFLYTVSMERNPPSTGIKRYCRQEWKRVHSSESALHLYS